jgi:hypothetical protein
MKDLLRCSDVLERLPLFVGDDLEPDMLLAVQEHLRQCEACSEQLRIAERARGALVATLRARLAPPEGGTRGAELWPDIRARLEREGILGSPAPRSVASQPLVPARPRGRRLAWPMRIVAAAAALLLVLWLAEGTGEPGDGQGPRGVGEQLVAVPSAGPQSEDPPAMGGLRKLEFGEDSFSHKAEPFRVVRPQAGESLNTLAGYR